MRFRPVDMLLWAREAAAEAPCHIGRSGMPTPPTSLFGGALHDRPLEGGDGSGALDVPGMLAARFRLAADEVALAPGTTGANFYAAAGLLEDGDEVLVEAPTYGPLLQVVEALTPNVRRFPRRAETGWQPDLEALGAALSADTKLVVLTNLHNPTGARIAPETMTALLDLVEARSPAHVLVDEVYLEMADDPTATAYRPGRRVLATRSLTKAYGLGDVRAGWLMGPRDAVARARVVRDHVNVHDPYPATAVMAAALGHLSSLRTRLSEALAASDAAFRPFFATRSDLDVVWPHQPFMFFPRVRTVSTRFGSTTDLARRLRHDHGVAVVPGELFGAPGHLRLGAVGQPRLLEEGLPKLAVLLDGLRV